MALLDVTEDRRLYRCAACNRIAVAKSRAAKYCSDTCRERMQKRRTRAKQPGENRNGAATRRHKCCTR